MGAGRPGWAGAHGCPRRRPVCGPFPRLGFAARGRCGPSRETRQGSRVTPWRGKGNGFVRHEETRGAVSAGRLRLRGDDLPRSSSGGLLKRPPMGSGSRVTPWDSRRGPALACAQGTTSAGHLARRRAGGGRDASWRMRVAAVTCCEADDRVVHSAALRAATPRPRRPTTTRRRPTAVSTGARRRHNGASVSRIAYRVSPRDPACAGGAPRATARALTENAACACGVRSIGRVDTTGCASSAGPTTAGVQLIRCVNRALRNSGTSPDVSRRREADTDYRDAPPTPPPRSLCPSCQCACVCLCAWA